MCTQSKVTLTSSTILTTNSSNSLTITSLKNGAHLPNLNDIHPIVLFTDTRPLSEITAWKKYKHLWRYRFSRCEPKPENWIGFYIPLSATSSLAKVHYTWARVFLTDTVSLLRPNWHILSDTDLAPTSRGRGTCPAWPAHILTTTLAKPRLASSLGQTPILMLVKALQSFRDTHLPDGRRAVRAHSKALVARC